MSSIIEKLHFGQTSTLTDKTFRHWGHLFIGQKVFGFDFAKTILHFGFNRKTFPDFKTAKIIHKPVGSVLSPAISLFGYSPPEAELKTLEIFDNFNFFRIFVSLLNLNNRRILKRRDFPFVIIFRHHERNSRVAGFRRIILRNLQCGLNVNDGDIRAQKANLLDGI